MNNSDPQVFLHHILDAIVLIENYTNDLSKEDFLATKEKQDSIVRELEIIGEAVRHLPEEYKRSHPELPWKEIAGTRDKLIHDYFGVDLELVWEIILKDLPSFKTQISELIE